MIHILKPTVSLAILFMLMSFQGGDILCDAKELKEKAQTILNPYKYDSSTLSKIVYKNTETIKELDVPLFIGEKYRFVFMLAALPKQVEIQIYNKDKDSKSRKLLFSSKDSGDKKEITFEIAKSHHVFIDYVIPPTETGSYSGCAVFMLGYK